MEAIEALVLTEKDLLPRYRERSINSVTMLCFDSILFEKFLIHDLIVYISNNGECKVLKSRYWGNNGETSQFSS